MAVQITKNKTKKRSIRPWVFALFIIIFGLIGLTMALSMSEDNAVRIRVLLGVISFFLLLIYFYKRSQ